MASGKSGSSSPGGPTPERRAIDSALASDQAFQTPTQKLARGLSDNVIGRWAPEHGAVEGNRALRSLAFADRIISPYVGQAEASASSGLVHPASAMRPLRVTPISSWLSGILAPPVVAEASAASILPWMEEVARQRETGAFIGTQSGEKP